MGRLGLPPWRVVSRETGRESCTNAPGKHRWPHIPSVFPNLMGMGWPLGARPGPAAMVSPSGPLGGQCHPQVGTCQPILRPQPQSPEGSVKTRPWGERGSCGHPPQGQATAGQESGLLFQPCPHTPRQHCLPSGMWAVPAPGHCRWEGPQLATTRTQCPAPASCHRAWACQAPSLAYHVGGNPQALTHQPASGTEQLPKRQGPQQVPQTIPTSCGPQVEPKT